MKKNLFLNIALFCTIAQGTWAQTTVSTDSELRTAIQTDGANITVTADIDLSNSTLSIESGKTITIDLNDHTLDRKLTKRGEGGGQVITVRNGATLNLINGTLKGGWGGAGGALVNEGGTVTLTDVIITNNVADDRGGGICNREGGTLTMTGGVITDNRSNDHSGAKGGGGLFNEEGATATLAGVTLTGNEAKVCGGGGICNFGTLTIDNCTITGNTAATYGGAIWQEGTLQMQGAMTVTGNTTMGSTTNNLFLKTGAVITVTGALTPLPQQGGAGGGSIGINMESLIGTFTSGFKAHNSGVAPASIFTSDLSLSTALSLTSGGEAQLSNISDVNFIERSWDKNNKQVVSTVKTLSHQIGYAEVPASESDYKIISAGESPNWFQLGGYNKDIHEYYVVRGDVSNTTLNVLGNDVHIILCDGAKLTLSGGILTYMTDNHKASLYIHCQSYGMVMGKLRVESGYDDYAAGIGSDYADVNGHVDRTQGNLAIHGGDIYVKGGEHGSGIGGGYHQSGGETTIYGGRIEARGGEGGIVYAGGSGIGGAHMGNAGYIRIYDGTIYAYGGDGCSGIGAGNDGRYLGCIEIYGGSTYAYGGDDGAGIGSGRDGFSGGVITVNDGYVEAYGGKHSAGFGGGNRASGFPIDLLGGTVKAWGGKYGAGIGRGADAPWDVLEKVRIKGGHVEAYAGTDAAGIGGGEHSNGGILEITGGSVYAEGNDNGAGIGGGEDAKGSDVTITGGTVIIQSGGDQRAIGAGYGNDVHKELTFADNMGVFVTTNLNRSLRENRVQDCRNFAYVKISQCAHGGATASIPNGSVHNISNCKWCYFRGQGNHTFGDYGQCGVCGLVSLADDADNGGTISHLDGSTDKSVTLSGRTLYKDGDWNTLCLPFSLASLTDTPLDGATVKTLESSDFDKSSGTLALNFTQDANNLTSIEAGKPYIVKWNEGDDIIAPVFTNVTISSATSEVETDYTDFVGIYSPMAFAGVDRSILYLGTSNTLYYPSQDKTINACRAYFRLNGITAADIPNGVKMFFGDEEATAIEEIVNSKSLDAWYTLDGRRVDNSKFKIHNSKLPCGIYINNGNKIIIK